jgi:hypothetical protein
MQRKSQRRLTRKGLGLQSSALLQRLSDRRHYDIQDRRRNGQQRVSFSAYLVVKSYGILLRSVLRADAVYQGAKIRHLEK